MWFYLKKRLLSRQEQKDTLVSQIAIQQLTQKSKHLFAKINSSLKRCREFRREEHCHGIEEDEFMEAQDN